MLILIALLASHCVVLASPRTSLPPPTGIVLCSPEDPASLTCAAEIARMLAQELEGTVRVRHLVPPGGTGTWESAPEKVSEAIKALAKEEGVLNAAVVNIPAALMLRFRNDAKNRAAAGSVRDRAARLSNALKNGANATVTASRAPAAACDVCTASDYSGAGVRPSDLSCLSGAVVAGPVEALQHMLAEVGAAARAHNQPRPCNADSAVQHYASTFPKRLREAQPGTLTSFATAAEGCLALDARLDALFIKAEAPACAAEMQLRILDELRRDALIDLANANVTAPVAGARQANATTPRKGGRKLSRTAQLVLTSILMLAAVAVAVLVVLWASRTITRRSMRYRPPPAPIRKRTTTYATIIHLRL